ncbi:ANTAR domain-containing protein [Rhizomicrobium electricum]|uniref:ANTAR domain-containing protein n=1 Tax=Rhizomicrobium electricum TaxID=480070 RepID=A0ABN1ES67_9PROT
MPPAGLTILLVDANGRRAAELARLIASAGDHRVYRSAGGAGLADEVLALKPSVVLVDMSLPDRDTLEGLRQVSSRSPCPVVLMTEETADDFVEEAIQAGVCSYHVGGVDPMAIRPILAAAIALFARHQRATKERDASLAQLEERRIIDRAKTLLMRSSRMSEPEAYRWLRSRAMRESRKLADVAADLIAKSGDAP